MHYEMLFGHIWSMIAHIPPKHHHTVLTCMGDLQGAITSLTSLCLAHSQLKLDFKKFWLVVSAQQLTQRATTKIFFSERKERFLSCESRASPCFLHLRIIYKRCEKLSYCYSIIYHGFCLLVTYCFCKFFTGTSFITLINLYIFDADQFIVSSLTSLNPNHVIIEQIK